MKTKFLFQNLILLSVISLILFPIANDFFNFIREPAPKGIAPAKKYLKFTYDNYLNRKWQRIIEDRAKKESGLWDFGMRLANQLYLQVFNQISPFFNSSVAMAKSGHLFQAAHLKEFNRLKKIKNAKLLAQIKEFKLVQDYMKSQGKTILLVISPNLIFLYPELLPDRYKNPKRDSLVDNYQTLISVLDDLKIDYVDTFQLLNDHKNKYPFKFFAPSASHWNDVASCLALQGINSKLKSLNVNKFRDFSCEKWHFENTPKVKDRDLSDIANLINPSVLYQATPYVDLEYLEPEPSVKPSTLLVGTSFLFAFMEQLHDWKLTDDVVHYFYFKNWRKGGERRFRGLNRKTLDWDKVLNKDLIIVNIGTNSPGSMGYGFVKSAAEQIKLKQNK